jgi:hypothetical protein
MSTVRLSRPNFCRGKLSAFRLRQCKGMVGLIRRRPTMKEFFTGNDNPVEATLHLSNCGTPV